MDKMKREGEVLFGDASLTIREDGPPRSTSSEERQQWDKDFSDQVFYRVISTLEKIGWTCTKPGVSGHDVKHYGVEAASRHAETKRFCNKGDLKADLSIAGRMIDLKMFQSVNCPTRPDHNGRYESDKEGCMPYLLRLEMERTRQRVRDDLMQVCVGYTFQESSRRGWEQLPVQQKLSRIYAESWHFKGDNWESHKLHPGMTINRVSADKKLLEHGQHVWYFDEKGRIQEGHAFYNSNSMWWVASGKYSLTNVPVYKIFTTMPEAPRVKRNAEIRRVSLEKAFKQAVTALDFKQAETIKKLLFPEGPLYAIWSKENRAYFAILYRGYRDKLAEAGLYTRAELKPYLGNQLETEDLKAVLVSGEEQICSQPDERAATQRQPECMRG